MTRGTVLIADPIGGDPSVIVETLASHGLLAITPTPTESWQDLASNADGLIVNLAKVDSGVFARLQRCRVIARLGVGFDGIDVTAARTRGICVTNVPDYCTEEVSDHALALIMTLIRKVPIANADVQQGRWDQLSYRPIQRVGGLTLGLIGFGRLARVLARKAGALGMRIVAHDPYASQGPANPVELVSLEALLAAADVISLHAPLLPETRGIIGPQTLKLLKRGAILVNTSRGELVDENALVAALDSGSVAAAALDVFSHEPLPMNSSLRGRANVILTPHIAFYSEQSLIQLQRTAAEDVARALSGEAPLHRVA